MMPRNLFGPRQQQNLNPLLAMLQQGPQDQQQKKPYVPSQQLLDLGSVPMEGADPDELRAQEAQILANDKPKSLGLWDRGWRTGGKSDPADSARVGRVAQDVLKWIDTPPQGPQGRASFTAPPEIPGIPKQLTDQGFVPMEGADPNQLNEQIGQLMSQQRPLNQPDVTVQGQGERQPGDFLRELDAQDAQERESSAQGFGQFVPPGITEAVQDSVRQYGIAEQDYQKAELALKKEFQDTPEIDEALSKAKLSLTQAQMQRKQPTAMDYIAMALMNLSGVPPQTSAAMVLGLDDQARREEMLEGRVMGLEDAKISGRMQGRRDYRSMQARGASEEAERQFKMSEIMRDQSNKDRDFGFKQQDQMADLMRALAGQEGETERGSLDEATRKKSAASRDLMKKLLQVDDRALQEMLRQRQQPQQPQDKRQSRMFGSLIGDQFA
jgi:hypothetical protein